MVFLKGFRNKKRTPGQQEQRSCDTDVLVLNHPGHHWPKQFLILSTFVGTSYTLAIGVPALIQ
jgi:hypothetical protein